MGKIIETLIDGVPVQLEVKVIGPASPDDIRRLNASLDGEISSSENLKPSKPDVTTTVPVPVNEASNTTETKPIETKPAPIELAGDLIDSIQNVPVGKEWWQSRTVWVNILAIATSIGATIGFNVPITPEMAMILYPIILGAVNLVLRSITKKPLNPVAKSLNRLIS